MARTIDRDKVQQSISEGRTGGVIPILNKKTGEVIDTASTPQEAYQKGWIASPTFADIITPTKLYKTTSGYSRLAPTSSSVSLDKKTGKITLTLPDDVKDSSLWNNYKEGLKSLAESYKADPNGTYPIYDAEGKTTGKTRTIDELIAHLNEADNMENTQSVNTIANAIRGIRQSGQNAKKYVNDVFGTSVNLDLSDEKLNIFTSALATGDDSSDSSYLWVSDLPALGFLRNLESYNSETGYAQKGDILKNGWNQDKVSGDELDRAIDALEAYFEKGEFASEEELLKNLATYQFLVETNVGGSFLSTVYNTVGWSLASYTKAFIDDIANFSSFMAQMVSVTATKEGEAESAARADEKDSDSFTNSMLAWMTSSDVEDIERYWHHAQIKSSTARAGIGLGELAGLAASGIVEGKVINFGLSKVVGGFAGLAGKLSNAANGALKGNELYQNVLNSALIAADSAEDLVGIGTAISKTPWLQVSEGMSILSKLPGGVNALTKLYIGLTKTSLMLGGATMLTPGWKFTQAVTGQLLDLISNLASQEPDLLASFLKSEEMSDEDKAKLLSTTKSTILFQAGFGTIAGVGGKLLKGITGAVKSTHLYQAANANIGRKMAKASLKLSNIIKTIQLNTIGKLKGVTDWEDYIKTIKNPKKRTALDYDKLINDAKQVIADAERVGYKNTAEARAALEAVRSAQDDLRSLYTARTRAYQEGAGYIRQWLYTLEYPELSSSWRQLQDVTDEIIAAEKRLGLRGYSIKAGAGRTFSQETVDYIGAKSKIPFLNNYIDKYKMDPSKAKQVLAAKDELVVLNGFVDTFLSKADTNLIAAADKYVGVNKTFWYNFTDLRVAQGLSVKDEIDEDRASLLWGKGGVDYARTQRQTGERNLLILNSDGTFYRRLTSDLDEYSLGAKEHFVDPFITQILAIKEAASQRARLDFAEGYVKTMSPKASLTGDESRLLWNSERTRKARKALNAETNQALDGILQSFDREGVVENIFSRRTDIASTPSRTTSAFQFRADAGALDDDAINTLFERYYGTEFSAIDMLVANANEKGAIALSNLDESTARTVRNGIDEYRAAHSLPTSETYTVRDLAQAVEYDQTLTQKLTRSMVLSNSEIMDSRAAKQMVADLNRQQGVYNRSTLYADSLEKLDKAINALPRETQVQLGNVPDFLESLVDDFVDRLANTPTLQSQLKVLLQDGSAANEATAIRYLTLEALMDKKGDLSSKLQRQIETFIGSNKSLQSLTVKQQNDIVEAITGLMDDVVEAKYGAALTSAKGANLHLIDEEAFYQRASELREAVQGYKSRNDVIAIPDNWGNLEYFEVDPALNRLMTHGTGREAMSGLKRVNYLWSKAWRFGTTTWRLASMVRQTFTDSFNAVVGGGMYQTIKTSKDELTQLFGSNVGEFISTYTPEAIQALEKASGVSLEEALEGGTKAFKFGKAMADFEVSRGEAALAGSSELAAYNIGAEGYATRYISPQGTNRGRITSDTTRSIRQRIHDLRDSIVNPNDVRETLLRSTTFANNLNAGIQNDMSLKQARQYAEFMAQEGTTNFSNLLSHLTGLGDVTPYLASSINGSKSFYRLLSLDPLGTFGRLFTNGVIPAMAMTAYSLSSEENREVYRKLKEYQKQNNLVFVINGQVLTIPLPNEIGAFINPWRQLVEGMYDVQNYSFWELALNNIAGFSPLDITGFTNPDYNRIAASAGVVDWFSAGTARLASDVLPPFFRTAYIAFTRKDPYTGNSIGADAYYWDDDTQSMQLANNLSIQMARTVADATNGLIDAPLADALLNGIFGSQVVDLVDGVLNLAMVATGNAEASVLDNTLSGMAQDAFGSLYVPSQKEKGTADWRSTTYMLQQEKSQIINSKRWQTYLTNYRNATEGGDTEKLKALAAERKNIWQPYYDKVLSSVNTLNQLYPDQFTGYKLATAISLMTVDLGASDASVDTSSDDYLRARSQAIETMVEMGFPSASGEGVLGQIKQVYSDATGATTKMSDLLPLVFLDMENKLYYSGAIHAESLGNVLTQNGITNSALNEAWEKYRSAKSTADKRKIAVEWDTKVAIAIAPYVQRYGATNIMKSSDVIDLLDGWLIIPSDYTRYNGKSTYNPKNNTTRGYSQQFLKDIFGAKK